MGDFSDDYGGYDFYDRMALDEQRDKERRAQRAKLLALPETPKYAIKAHWESDGRIGVVAAIVRPDGGIHLLQDFLDPLQRINQEPVAKYSDIVSDGGFDPRNKFDAPPQRTWVGLTEAKIREVWLKGKDHGDDWTDVLALARSFEAELKELNK
jgi:hypothetical protein